MNAPRHLYLDTTGKKLVAEDDPQAAELLAAEGSPINTRRLHVAGLTLDDVREHVGEGEPAQNRAEGAQEARETASDAKPDSEAKAPKTALRDRQR